MSDASKSPRWKTSLSYADSERIVYRGYKVQDLMEAYDFGAMFYLVLRGELPSPGQAKILNAILVALVDHGIVPSTGVSRILAACGVPLQAAVAGGVLTIGDIHGGAGQEFSFLIQSWVKEWRQGGQALDEFATELVSGYRAQKKRLPGFGHPLHPTVDPRVDKLRELAIRWGVEGDHLRMANALERALAGVLRRPLVLNVDGVVAAITSDLGFDWQVARAFVFIPRSLGLAAHAHEETVREKGWRVIAEDDEVVYDGPPDRRL